MTTQLAPLPGTRHRAAPLAPGAPLAAAATASGRRLVHAEELRKSFAAGRRSIEILHGVSITLHEGETCAVMGPSGSGKSTLLHCLAGLEDASGGTVTLLGRQLSGLSLAARARLRRTDAGFVFQSYNLIPTLSAYENVALPFRLSGRRPPRDAIVATLTGLGLGGVLTALPPTMSGGEQQRVALARVLALRPRLVFADEPTGALDTASGRRVLDSLVGLARDGGRGVLVVTHDPIVAARCDRVVFLCDGHLVHSLVAPSVDMVTAVLGGLTDRAEAPGC